LGWPSLSGLFEAPYDYDKIRRNASQFTLFHSNDDPYCPLDHAEYLAEKLDGELHIQPGQKHFSIETDPKYTTFPLLKEWLIGRE
jgi:predicted alpha/beta hydrolase family esterase